jgi:hypothetical protein
MLRNFLYVYIIAHAQHLIYWQAGPACSWCLVDIPYQRMFSLSHLMTLMIRASPLGGRPCTLESDEKKVNICRFRSWTWVFFFSCAPARGECNKYDLTDVPWFRLVNHTDWSRWFAISSSHLFTVIVSVLWVGLQKSK